MAEVHDGTKRGMIVAVTRSSTSAAAAAAGGELKFAVGGGGGGVAALEVFFVLQGMQVSEFMSGPVSLT